VPAETVVDEQTRQALTALALGSASILDQADQAREMLREGSGLDPRGYALVKIAALVAVDAPPASYLYQVDEALQAGATPKDILGVLAAIAPQIGIPRVVAAAPELMVALDLELPDGVDG
jgi:alkylhydroperoxidase/carboxymuconolactone decarboxylase family protein YurZ